MSENQSEALSLPAKLPLLAILGLREPEDANWSRLRALQYAKVAKHTKLRAFSHAICAGFAVWASFDVLSQPAIFAWLAALVAALFYFTSQDWLLRRADGRTLSLQAAHRHTTGTAVVALVWCAPMVLHLIFGSSASLLAMWTVVALVAVGSGIVLATAPLGAFIYVILTCGTGAITMYLAGLYGPAAVAATLAVVIGYGIIARAETFLRHSVAQAGMTERNEVVSLLLREFEENEADWLWQIDNSRRIRSASPRFAFALGMQPEDIEGAPFLQLVSGRAWDSGQFPTSLHDLAERLKRRESFSNLLVKVTIGDQQRWWELSGTPMLDEKGQNLGFRGVGSDVTEQRESSEKIAYLARYDTLTGLPNRLMLHEALGEAMRYAKQWRTRCSFLMIDLDRFKAVNDSLGHMVGDRLLAQVSARLKELMTDNEMCGRLGGDEFAIVIRDASDPKTTARVAQRIIDRLSQPYEVDNHTLYVGASVGSAIAPRDGKTVEELMRNADLALYRSKDTGGGEHCEYEPALHALAEERRQLEFSLRKALERKELMLNFQPIVDTMNESIVSFEAL
ncbi:diguanylate cyclase, partial [Altererythrobacter sp.]|nr:diguanylate cyclase [Altererythrobacter sp.]